MPGSLRPRRPCPGDDVRVRADNRVTPAWGITLAGLSIEAVVGAAQGNRILMESQTQRTFAPSVRVLKPPETAFDGALSLIATGALHLSGGWRKSPCHIPAGVLYCTCGELTAAWPSQAIITHSSHTRPLCQGPLAQGRGSLRGSHGSGERSVLLDTSGAQRPAGCAPSAGPRCPRHPRSCFPGRDGAARCRKDPPVS